VDEEEIGESPMDQQQSMSMEEMVVEDDVDAGPTLRVGGYVPGDSPTQRVQPDIHEPGECLLKRLYCLLEVLFKFCILL
jgi:hypothetical protein